MAPNVVSAPPYAFHAQAIQLIALLVRIRMESLLVVPHPQTVHLLNTKIAVQLAQAAIALALHATVALVMSVCHVPTHQVS